MLAIEKELMANFRSKNNYQNQENTKERQLFKQPSEVHVDRVDRGRNGESRQEIIE